MKRRAKAIEFPTDLPGPSARVLKRPRVLACKWSMTQEQVLAFKRWFEFLPQPGAKA